MTGPEADNRRLRQCLRRVIAEREIAHKALMRIAFDELTAREAAGIADAALDAMLAVPVPERT